MPSLWADSLDEHRRLVLGRLLDAYEDLATDRGVEGVTLAAVAERAGLARSAIYTYVRDKHDLVLAHAQRSLDGATERLAADVRAATTPSARLRAYIRHTLLAHGSSGGPAEDLMPMLAPEEQAQLVTMLAPLRTMLEGIVEEGLATGEFSGAASDLTLLVWTTLAGLRVPVLHGHLPAEETAAVIAHLLLDGMRTR